MLVDFIYYVKLNFFESWFQIMCLYTKKQLCVKEIYKRTLFNTCIMIAKFVSIKFNFIIKNFEYVFISNIII